MASYASPRKGKQIFIREVIDGILNITYVREIATFTVDVYFTDVCHTLTVKYELLKFNLHQFSTYLEKKAFKSG